jgi:RND family efflux transporter MFP subunit
MFKPKGDENGMKKKWVRIVIAAAVVVALVAAALLLVYLKKRNLARAPRYGLDPRRVTVVMARKGELVDRADYLAVVEPVATANVRSRVTARIEKVLVDEGDRVKAGDQLVKLDSNEVEHRIDTIRAQVDQAQADLAGNKAVVRALEKSYDYWKSELKRDRDLADKGFVTDAQAQKTREKAAEVRGRLESARQKSRAIRHRIEGLRGQLQELGAQLGYHVIKSPYDGVLTERHVDSGDLASPTVPLVRLADKSALKLTFDVPQADLPSVREGLAVQFVREGKVRRADITVMHPSFNEARMRRAEAWLRGDARAGLSIGAYVPVSVVLRRMEGVVLVPRSSVIDSPTGKPYAFVVVDDRLEPREVEPLGYSGDEVAVLGLDEGEEVVENTFLGWARLSSGEKVEPVR